MFDLTHDHLLHLSLAITLIGCGVPSRAPASPSATPPVVAGAEVVPAWGELPAPPVASASLLA